MLIYDFLNIKMSAKYTNRRLQVGSRTRGHCCECPRL